MCIHHALQQKGVDIATRTQQAFFDRCQRHPQLFFPLNRGGGRFVALCLLLLNRSLKGERTLIVAPSHVLRRYIASDLQSLGAFCPLQISVFHSEEGEIAEAVQKDHITMISTVRLPKIESDISKIDNLILIEPENYNSEEVTLLLETIQPKTCIGLYQRRQQLQDFWYTNLPELHCVVFGKQTPKTFLGLWKQEEDLLSQLQRVILHIDKPMLLVCEDDTQVQEIYSGLSQKMEMVCPIWKNSLRRNKDKAFRLLSMKKLRVLILSKSTYKNTNHPIIDVTEERPSVETDCYWLPKEEPVEKEGLTEIVIPTLEELLQREQNRFLQQLQKKSLHPISQEIEDLFSVLHDQPLLLKVALQEYMQSHTNNLYEYEQEVVRIEGKEDKRKQSWRPHHKRRNRRR